MIKQRTVSQSGRTVVAGKIIDCETGRPLLRSLFVLDRQTIYTDSTGTFCMNVSPGTHQLRAGWVGYEFVTTQTKLRARDSVYILFRLKIDQRPLDGK